MDYRLHQPGFPDEGLTNRIPRAQISLNLISNQINIGKSSLKYVPCLFVSISAFH